LTPADVRRGSKQKLGQKINRKKSRKVTWSTLQASFSRIPGGKGKDD